MEDADGDLTTERKIKEDLLLQLEQEADILDEIKVTHFCELLLIIDKAELKEKERLLVRKTSETHKKDSQIKVMLHKILPLIKIAI